MSPRTGHFTLLPRRPNTDKRSYGHVLVLAGSLDYPGAALLCASAASVSGAGLVTLAVPGSIREAVLRRFPPEIMPVFLPSTSSGGLSERALSRLTALIRGRKMSVLAMGPGLGKDPSTQRLVRRLVRTQDLPVVLDADGLGAFSGQLPQLISHRGALVLTPHDGEFMRLFGQKADKARAKGALLAKKLSRIYDVVLVLKGHGTRVIRRDRVVVNRTGGPAMAKGGSGDVLTGILAAFLAQGLSPFEAAAWAVRFHGKAGDLAARKRSQLAVRASDLISCLPKAFLLE